MNGIRFVHYSGSNLWVVLGQTSAWPNELSPPTVDPTATTVNSPFCAFKATAQLVVENDVSGTYAFVDSTGHTHLYSVVSSDSAYLTAEDTIIMLSGTVTGTNLFGLASSFRQVGFATGLIPASGHESDTFLPAANVVSWGELESLENRVPVTIIEASNYMVSALIQY